jgi:hypothetical protein
MRASSPRSRRRTRLRTTVDPRAFGGGQADFLARALQELGIRPHDVADLGNENSVAMSVWDTEAECKAAYDGLVAGTNAKVGS